MFNTYRLSLQSLFSRDGHALRDKYEADLLTKVGLSIILTSIVVGTPLTIYFAFQLEYINMLAAAGAVVINFIAFGLFKLKSIQHALVLNTTFSYLSLLIVIFFFSFETFFGARSFVACSSSFLFFVVVLAVFAET
ncbi:MAG: hypothetical protein AAF633_14605, partial [Chloroflexota bacterium]